MDKLRLLCVAPYDGLREVVQNIASQQANLQILTFVGDREVGVNIAKEHASEVDAIISRGITAEMISKACTIPVVHIVFSSYDILRAIRTAQSLEKEFAIVGLPEVTDCAKLLCDALQYHNIRIVPLTSQAELDNALLQLKSEGITLVVGDLATVSRAQMLALRGILIISGIESVDEAIKEAVRETLPYKVAAQQASFYQNILEALTSDIMIYTQDQKLLYSSVKTGDQALLQQQVLLQISQIETGKTLHAVFTDSDTLVQINGTLIDGTDNKSYYLFQIERMLHKQPEISQYIHYYNIHELDGRPYHLNVSLCSESEEFYNLLEKSSQTENIFLVSGEYGTNIDGVAIYLHRSSVYNTCPYIVFDCGKCSEKSWNYFLNNYQSPLYGKRATIHIKNFNLLSQKQFSQLLPYLSDQFIGSRLRLIFSCITGEQLSIKTLFTQYPELLSVTFALHIPALREHKKDIWELSNFYVNELAFTNGKNILGLAPEANNILQSYDWPHNNNQLWRIMEQATLMTEKSYIPSELIEVLIKQQSEDILASNNHPIVIDLDKSLKDIEHEIILTILKRENFNQSRTAKRLQISRSTLHRIISKDLFLP